MRRVISSLIVLFFAAAPRHLMAPGRGGVEAGAITTLRAINAAQLVHQTSVGEGRYASTLAELGVSLRPGYRFELFSTGESYAAIATPLPHPRKDMRGTRAFCVDMDGSIFQNSTGIPPAIEKGRCVDRSNPIR